MSVTWDVAVIGAGVFGAWTAYRLAQTGRTVILIDARGAADPRTSSGAESRVIRMGYGANDLYTRFAQRSLASWKQFFAESGENLFRQTGVMWFADPADDRLSASRQTLLRTEVHFEDRSAADIQRRNPQFRFTSEVAGILEPDSGALLAGAAVRAVVKAAQKIGVTFSVEFLAEPIRTPVAQISAGTFVFACGAWLPKLFPEILGRVILPTRQPLFFFEPPAGNADFSPSCLPIWIDNTDPRLPYGFPDIDGQGIKMGFHREGPRFDPDYGDRNVTAEEVTEAREYVSGRLPGLAAARVIGSKVCQYENTHSGDFLIDRHPEFANVWFVGGGSGHGFKHGPAVADYIVGRIEGSVLEEPSFALMTEIRRSRRAVT